MTRKEKEKWKNISSKPLDLKFMLDNKDYLDFKLVSKNSMISFGVIAKELEDYVDWNNIVIYQPEAIIEESADFIWNRAYKIDWEKISCHKDLKVEHLDLYGGYLNWNAVVARHKYTEEELLRFEKNVDWSQACISQKLSSEFIDKHWLKLYPYKYEICKYQKLTEEFLEKYKDSLDWSLISQYQTLSESFIDKMSDYVDWDWISEKQKLSKQFISDHADKLNIFRMIMLKRSLPTDIKHSMYGSICKYYIKNYT